MKFAGLRWELKCDSSLQNAFIFADKQKIEQVLRNFMSNAIKFTPSGGSICLTAVVFPMAMPFASSSGSCRNDEHAIVLDERSLCIESVSSRSTATPHNSFKDQELMLRIEITDTGPGIALVRHRICCTLLHCLIMHICRRTNPNCSDSLCSLMPASCRKAVDRDWDCG